MLLPKNLIRPLLLLIFFVSALSVEANDVIGIRPVSESEMSSNNPLSVVVDPSYSSTKSAKQKKGFFKRMKERVAHKKLSEILQSFQFDSLKCDVIVLKDGEEIEARILEVNTGAVLYELCDQENGPRRTLLNSKVFMIKYADGYKEVFNNKSNSKSRDDGYVYSEKQEPRRYTMAIGFVLGLLLSLLGVLLAFLIYYDDRYSRKKAVQGAWLGILMYLVIIFYLASVL